ncbi:hypothetical protein MUB18_13390 [Sphingobacterium sp. PCS056]|uniref:hypothetical protein n=1 Tax=Sphingobacterium TaxID=28453 RepID=UPI00200C9C31|nr:MULTISPECIES: hypothetical protein [unclassified Sphingobacterium]UPZ35097.1 hypothetical protein MUB18_13390 [Sphingobacterium sp. PCS056]
MIDQDTQNYVITHYLHLMSPHEKLAYKHIHSLLKLEGNKDLDKMKKIYLKTGWLTKDRIALSLIRDGSEKFYKNTAERILAHHHSQITFNNCPKCGKLARTPLARQCKHCYFDWH